MLESIGTSRWADEEIVMFDEAVGRFVQKELTPDRLASWREAGMVPKDIWEKCSKAGLLGLSIAPEFGGSGGDFRHEAILIRQLGLAGAEGFGVPLHNAICAAYIEKYGTAAQRERWLPGMCSGQFIAAIAMTEPGAGSDLQGIRSRAFADEGGYRLTGQKTFITNGQMANLIIIVAKTNPDAGSKGISLFALETDNAEGFSRGKNLEKIGTEMGDTSELFFDDVYLPADTLIGEVEGQGLYQLMKELPKERLIIACESLAIIEAALTETVAYVTERKAFGKTLLEFQNTEFKFAECKTEATIARTFIDECIVRLLENRLTAEYASMAKYWVSETAQKIVDTCQQMFGGYGYMSEYPIAQMYKDVRVKRIYGGTTEIMKLLIARSLAN